MANKKNARDREPSSRERKRARRGLQSGAQGHVLLILAAALAKLPCLESREEQQYLATTALGCAGAYIPRHDSANAAHQKIRQKIALTLDAIVAASALRCDAGDAGDAGDPGGDDEDFDEDEDEDDDEDDGGVCQCRGCDHRCATQGALVDHYLEEHGAECPGADELDALRREHGEVDVDGDGGGACASKCYPTVVAHEHDTEEDAELAEHMATATTTAAAAAAAEEAAAAARSKTQLALGLVPAPQQQQQPQQQEEGAECPICFIDTDADDLARLACGHAFCLSCMESWESRTGSGQRTRRSSARTSCPMCRAQSRFSVVQAPSSGGRKRKREPGQGAELDQNLRIDQRPRLSLPASQ